MMILYMPLERISKLKLSIWTYFFKLEPNIANEILR